jgi:hypothetical protein
MRELRHSGRFERQLRRDDIIGELRRGRHVVVERNQEFELLHRCKRLSLIGPSHHRVATHTDQHPHLPIALEQNLIG